MLAAISYPLAALVGYVGARSDVPLAWMLGPLLFAACLSVAGLPLAPNGKLRRLGQTLIGVGVGLNFTAEAMRELMSRFPLMVLTALLSVLVACIASVALARFARLDRATAFFACLPGGLAEMAEIGQSSGARPEAVTILHTLRVTLVVMTVPPLLIALGTPDLGLQTQAQSVSVGWVIGLGLGGLVVALGLGKIHLRNPYMIGAILFSAVLSANGMIVGKLPPILFAGAQLLVGFAVGCRFRRDILMTLPRAAAVGTLVILAIMGVMALFGWLLALRLGVPFASGLLSSTPGGLAEMGVTAQLLHLGVPSIIGFQITRVVMVNGFATQYFVMLTRSGVFSYLEGMLGGRGG